MSLIAYKTKALYGDKVNFNNLSVSQKNAVYSAVVQSAGKSNLEVNIKMQRLSGAGRGLIFLSLAVAVYQIYEAEDRVPETQRQLALSSAGIAGACGGGALAGLMCDSGAPVCEVIGAFVGGAIAAWEISGFWD